MNKEQETITLYDAIKEMRKLSSQERSFSFSHSTWNQDTQECNGIRHVNKAILRPAGRNDEIRDADLKLFYKDLDNNEKRNCWQPLIMFFNDKRCILN